jgi:cobalamin biosynthesis protein CobT
MENNNVDVLTILNEINDTMKLVLAEIKKGNEQKVKNTPNLFDIFGGMQQNQGVDDDEEEEEEDEDEDEDEGSDEDEDEDGECEAEEAEEAEDNDDVEESEEQAQETPKVI